MFTVIYRGRKFSTYDARSYANACKRAFRFWIREGAIKNQPRQDTYGFIGVTVVYRDSAGNPCWSHSN